MPQRNPPGNFNVYTALGGLGMLLSFLGCGGCGGGTLDLESADQAAIREVTQRRVDGIAAPPGFHVVQAAQGLNYPSAMDWDGQGRLFILQSHSVDLPLAGVKIVRVDQEGRLEDLELEGDDAPTGNVAVGLTFHDGFFYLSHEEKDGSWGVTRFHPETGHTEKVLRGLPGNADHWANHLVFGADGALYVGVGSATNSGVVSSQDPVNNKWLKVRPAGHDIPCRDLVLTAAGFSDDNATTDQKDDRATTGAFQPYGQSGATRLAGAALCTGAVYKLPRGASRPELVAWGFRNPVGLARTADGALYVAAQGADIRGTRPVADDADAIYRLEPGAWYGWPEFGGDLTRFTDPKFHVAAADSAGGQDGPVSVIDLAKSGLEAPDKKLLVYATEPHAAVCGMTVVPAGGLYPAFAGQLLVAEMGDFKPATDALHPDTRSGFQIEAIDLKTGKATVFLANAQKAADGSSQPASAIDLDHGLERPVDVRIGPDGKIYVLDFGVFQSTGPSAKVFPKTGRVFRVEPGSAGGA